MCDLKICRICLRTETKMYQLQSYQLQYYYEEVLAFKVTDNDGLPKFFCYECAAILHKFHKFKEKCYMGQKVLQEMLWQGSITYELVETVDRRNLNLIYTLSKASGTFDYFIKESKTENTNICKQTITDVDKNRAPVKLENELGEMEDDFANDDSSSDYDPMDGKMSRPVTVFIKADNIDCKMEDLDANEGRNKGDKTLQSKKRDVKILKLIEEGTWEKICLSEEEAKQEFKARSEEERYKTAENKCTDCYKTFSKEEMLLRHKKIRHSESNGPFECCFCKMRFKWDCLLRKHMSEHYTKYKCLRCNLICPLETTAILHEEYHTGMIKKCMYCDEEFRHPSTYYSHLRTHRSDHLCVLCGISFVSKIGLHQHKRKKHCTNNTESVDDDEDMNTFCARCDIRFVTRTAYERHIFQSTAHANEDGEGQNSILRKTLEKKPQDKGNVKYAKRKYGSRKCRKPNKKPSTCHQCGKHFDTQAACLKHHLAEHPRTSFYSSTERHICEICGASLAPGSIAHHQNTHTRKTLFPCDSCGKQFNSYGGLKRHQVTHTGEKPYACTLCDKRFTQSNSMKLHYKTFHLKEPWPKRNRKKKDNPQESEDRDSSDDELKDFSELKKTEKRMKPDVQSPENPTMHVLENANMQYLSISWGGEEAISGQARACQCIRFDISIP
ncbi:zinc finger protein 613-like [Aricia agestis]|uniref:zinc finger protein 613-like n=1 Tax=Aricia agestis TaxID=91739 RepID=UPI001C209DC3|nr:zinc finger protein 613-like [Aricia agestis]